MRITKIEITNYKSIKEPVEINFYNGLPTVLIGKNGSGKTNILEALSAITEANGNYLGPRRELPMSYKVHMPDDISATTVIMHFVLISVAPSFQTCPKSTSSLSRANNGANSPSCSRPAV